MTWLRSNSNLELFQASHKNQPAQEQRAGVQTELLGNRFQCFHSCVSDWHRLKLTHSEQSCRSLRARASPVGLTGPGLASPRLATLAHHRAPIHSAGLAFRPQWWWASGVFFKPWNLVFKQNHTQKSHIKCKPCTLGASCCFSSRGCSGHSLTFTVRVS